MFKLNFGSNGTKASDDSGSDSDQKGSNYHGRMFMRSDTIEEEPDSVDSIISNPASFPITVVPAKSLVRSGTQNSMGRYSRQSSSRYVL